MILFGREILPWRKPWSPPRAQRIPGRERLRQTLWTIFEAREDYYDVFVEEVPIIPHRVLLKFMQDGDDGALTEEQTATCARFCSGFGYNTATRELIRTRGLTLKRPEHASPKPHQPLRPPDEIIAETRLRRLAKLNPNWR
jgi:hypothetical protein